jgi:hypothetical protein
MLNKTANRVDSIVPILIAVVSAIVVGALAYVGIRS